MTAVVLVVLSVLTIAACLERARELHDRSTR